jgi:hypothetical protein
MLPLSEAFAATLKADATAALAALMLIANAHRDLYAWAARTFVGSEPEPPPRRVRRTPKLNDAGRTRAAKRPESRRARGAAASLDRRRAQRDRDDESLLEALKSAPDAAIGDWAEAIGKSRSSTITALKRLRDADRAESVEGKWKLTAEPAPREPPPKWVEKVRGTDRPREHHLT